LPRPRLEPGAESVATLRVVRSRVVILAILAVIAAASEIPVASPHSAMAGPKTTTNECAVSGAKAVVVRFLTAFNNGDARGLERLVAPEGVFQFYTVAGGVGQRVGGDASRRGSLMRYFSERHHHAERLTLERFDASRRADRRVVLRFEILRRGDDLRPPILYVGTGLIACGTTEWIAKWQMAPNRNLVLPAPTTYEETCKLVSAWCEQSPTAGGVPDELKRPLTLPTVGPSAKCPTTTGRRFHTSDVGGFALGDGPVRALVASGSAALAGRGILVFRPSGGRWGWYQSKTLWLAFPDYHGPLLIRGRQIGGSRPTVFGEAPTLVDPQLGPGATLNGSAGYREWPGGTWLRTPGCYAWQVDGTDFSEVITFEAVFAAAT
jgi:ketosteroid isomerase-like protein